MTKPIVAFRNFANAPKNAMRWVTKTVLARHHYSSTKENTKNMYVLQTVSLDGICCSSSRGQETRRYYPELSRHVSTNCCKTSQYRDGLCSSCLNEGRQTDMAELMCTPLYVYVRSRSVGMSRSKLPYSTAETQAVAHCVCSSQPAVQPTEQWNTAQTHTCENVLR